MTTTTARDRIASEIHLMSQEDVIAARGSIREAWRDATYQSGRSQIVTRATESLGKFPWRIASQMSKTVEYPVGIREHLPQRRGKAQRWVRRAISLSVVLLALAAILTANWTLWVPFISYFVWTFVAAVRVIRKPGTMRALQYRSDWKSGAEALLVLGATRDVELKPEETAAREMLKTVVAAAQGR